MKAQQRLEKCEAALENIKELLQQTRNTDINNVVVDTYRLVLLSIVLNVSRIWCFLYFIIDHLRTLFSIFHSNSRQC